MIIWGLFCVINVSAFLTCFLTIHVLYFWGNMLMIQCMETYWAIYFKQQNDLALLNSDTPRIESSVMPPSKNGACVINFVLSHQSCLKRSLISVFSYFSKYTVIGTVYPFFFAILPITVYYRVLYFPVHIILPVFSQCFTSLLSLIDLLWTRANNAFDQSDRLFTFVLSTNQIA